MSENPRGCEADHVDFLRKWAEDIRGNAGGHSSDAARLDAIADELAASRLQAPAVAEVEVKPLEWDTAGRAETVVGRFIVEQMHPGDEETWGLIHPGDEDMTFPHSFSGTKAECQAQGQVAFERYIRSALRTGGSE